jgi:hypothetical protein
VIRFGQCIHYVAGFAAGPRAAPSRVCCNKLYNLERHLYSVVYRIAANLLPNDPEIAFNLAAVLEASEV